MKYTPEQMLKSNIKLRTDLIEKRAYHLREAAAYARRIVQTSHAIKRLKEIYKLNDMGLR